MPNQSFKVTPVNPIPGFPAPPDPKPPPSNRKGVWRETIVSWHNAHVHGCLGHRDTWQTTPRCRCIPELTFWSLSRRFFFRLPIPSCQCFLGKKNHPPNTPCFWLAPGGVNIQNICKSHGQKWSIIQPDISPN